MEPYRKGFGRGVFGRERGTGLAEEHGVERRATAIVSTFGKALGMAGAFVAGPPSLACAFGLIRCAMAYAAAATGCGGISICAA